MNDVCKSLGDCGSYYNIAGVYTNKGAVWKSNGQRKVLDGILGGLRNAGNEEPTNTDSGTAPSEETIDTEPINTFDSTNTAVAAGAGA